jgi:hypothetical protein
MALIHSMEFSIIGEFVFLISLLYPASFKVLKTPELPRFIDDPLLSSKLEVFFLKYFLLDLWLVDVGKKALIPAFLIGLYVLLFQLSLG